MRRLTPYLLRLTYLLCGLALVGLAHGQTPTQPQAWVDNNEAFDGVNCGGYCVGQGYVAPQYELNLGTQTWVVGPPSSCTFHVPYWTVGSPSYSGLQSAVVDIEACRTAHSGNVGIILDVPPFNYSSAFGIYLPQSSSTALVPGNSFLILRSTLDSNLPNGTTVGSHGLQDNCSASATDIGLNNPDLTGQNMYYACGPSNVSGVISGITTLSTNTTTVAAIASTGSQCVALANGYVAPGVAEVVDTGGNQETVTTTSAANQNGMCGNFTKTHASGVPVSFCASGCSYTLANGNVINTANYNDLQYMWTSEGSGGAAFRACAPVGGGSLSSNVPACTSTTLAPQGWLIEDAEVRLQAGYTTQQDILQMAGSGSETSTSQYPAHIDLRKDWFHSDWSGLIVGRNKVLDAFALTGNYISLLDSQCSQILEPGNDYHCGSAEGPGPYKVVHNWLEGSASGCVSAGGTTGAGPSVFGLIPFSDSEFRRNRCTWPYAWLGQMTVPSGNSVYSGQSLDKKNIVEQKTLQRAVFKGNYFEHTDGSGGQQGPLGDWNVRNSSVGFGTYYQATITDLAITDNIFRSSCEGFETDKSSASSGNGGGVSNGVYRMLFANNLIYAVSTTNPGCSVANSKGIFLSNGASTSWQGTVTENSAGTAATFVANCSSSAGGCPGQIQSLAVNAAGSGCVAGNLVIGAPNISGGVQATGTYTCSGGALNTVTLTNAGTGYTSAPSVTLATGTGTVTVTMVSSPVTPTTGYQVLDLNAGDPVAITMCNSTPGLNTVTTASYGGKILPNEVGPLASSGSAAWTGTPTTSNLTVSYPFTFTANASDSGGFCTLTNVQGGPSQFQFQHNTFITDSAQAITSNNSPNNAFNFQIDAQFRDSILLGGGWSSSQGEGTNTEKVNADITSLTIDHVVWPTRTASNYTEYGNNPSYPDSAGCTGAGCHPPATMYFPSTAYCTGSSPTSGCVGFIGAMSASSMPLTLPDYHNFALISGSSFKSGGADQASDGTDMGANMAAIDAAQTQNLYVCAGPCGSPGPFPDVIPGSSSTNFTYGSGAGTGTFTISWH